MERSNHVCTYCQNEASAQCLVCENFFCNSFGDRKSSFSHIVLHLRQQNHRRVSIGDVILVCTERQCHNSNIFELGFLTTPDIISCRNCNGQQPNWRPLISNGKLLNVRQSTREEERKAAEVNLDAIARIENREIRTLQKIRLRYPNKRIYTQIFKEILDAEAAYDEGIKRPVSQPGISVNWERIRDSRGRIRAIVGKFYMSRYTLGPTISTSSVLELEGDSNGFKTTGLIGKIERVRRRDLLHFYVIKYDDSRVFETRSYVVSFSWTDEAFDRLNQGMKDFKYLPESDRLVKIILGNHMALESFNRNFNRGESLRGLPSLNSTQRRAVEQAVNSEFHLIQGPPGTGKTVTAATVIHYLLQHTQQQVLVAAPSNVAADEIAQKIHSLGLSVIRMYARSREVLDTASVPYALHELFEEEVKEARHSELRDLHDRKKSGEFLSIPEYAKYKRLAQELNQSILSPAKVIVCTCIGPYDKRIRNYRFDSVVIDESTQATEPETLLPMLTGVKQVVLIGDYKQLSPTVISPEARAAGLYHSMFERMVNLGHVPSLLKTQYRMHPAISEIPNLIFYDGQIEDGVRAHERELPGLNDFWPVRGKPVMFWHMTGSEEIAGSGTSYINREEAFSVLHIVRIVNEKTKRRSIGIITFYSGQKDFLTDFFADNGITNVEISSVDGFQGKEKDFVILSCVRSKDRGNIGFLRNSRRINVAITRAKYGLVVIGNANFLCKKQGWNQVLRMYNERGYIVRGDGAHLQRYEMEIPEIPVEETEDRAPYLVDNSDDEARND